MAGDWIKMRAALLAHPKVIALAEELVGIEEFREWLTPGGAAAWNLAKQPLVSLSALRRVTVGALLSVWSMSREFGHLDGDDLVLKGIDLFGLDEMGEVPGLGHAMAEVGWAVFDEASTSVRLPGFKAYNGPRDNAERQREWRERNTPRNSAVTARNDKRVTSPLPEKRREEKRDEEPPLPPSGERAGESANLQIPGKPDRTDWADVKARWNALAGKFGLKGILEVEGDRRRAYRARLATFPDFWAELEAALADVSEEARAKGFLTFDFAVRASGFRNLRERKYRNAFQVNAAPPSTRRCSMNEPDKFKGM